MTSEMCFDDDDYDDDDDDDDDDDIIFRDICPISMYTQQLPKRH